MAKKWSSAGQTFSTVAQHHAKVGNKHDSATNYVDAANCYKKSDPKGRLTSPRTEIRVWEKKLCLQLTPDSSTVFREESIGEGFKIVTVAVFEKILLFEKKIGSSFLTAIFKPTRVVTTFFSKITIVDPLFSLLKY